MKGFLQVYTGDGKGKTSAALGLVVRAVGTGLRVYFGQFIKRGNSGEIKILRERFPEVTVEQFGTGRFIRGKPSAEDIAAARAGLDTLRKALFSRHYDIVIADEINNAVSLELLDVNELIMLVKRKPRNVELVFTGRRVHPLVIEHADLVTEMKKIKHYFDKGVKARKGIEE